VNNAELPWLNDVLVVALLLTFTYIVYDNLLHRTGKESLCQFMVFTPVHLSGSR